LLIVLVAVIIVASASYWAVERPTRRLRLFFRDGEPPAR
jgi:peptidoglycan/LPS O-acetylase OafA/YrhL